VEVKKALMNRLKAEELAEAAELSPVLQSEIVRFARLGVVSPQDNGSVLFLLSLSPRLCCGSLSI